MMNLFPNIHIETQSPNDIQSPIHDDFRIEMFAELLLSEYLFKV